MTQQMKTGKKGQLGSLGWTGTRALFKMDNQQEPPQSTGNCSMLGAAWKGRGLGDHGHVYVRLSPFAVLLKLSQLAVLQYDIKQV